MTFGKKSDKNGDYIRKWLPQFKKFPAQFIYEPWKAPIEVQHDAGVVIGKDYPEPVVDHKIASKMNMAKMKIAYDANKTAAANDEEVDLDGLYDEQRQGEHEEHQSRGENKKKRKR